MQRPSFNEVLRSHHDARAPLNVGLVTGHQFDVRLGAIGEDWFSVESMSADSLGAVVSHRAIRTVRPSLRDFLDDTPPPKITPKFEVMLDNLCELEKHVVCYVGDFQWRGRIAQVGSDYVELDGPNRFMVLTKSVDWIRVSDRGCG